MTTDASAAGTTDQRRATWRAAQKARRARLQAKGKTLLRFWCTPEEAARIKETVKQWRRLERLRQLQRRAKDRR